MVEITFVISGFGVGFRRGWILGLERGPRKSLGVRLIPRRPFCWSRILIIMRTGHPFDGTHGQSISNAGARAWGAMQLEVLTGLRKSSFPQICVRCQPPSPAPSLVQPSMSRPRKTAVGLFEVRREPPWRVMLDGPPRSRGLHRRPGSLRRHFGPDGWCVYLRDVA